MKPLAGFERLSDIRCRSTSQLEPVIGRRLDHLPGLPHVPVASLRRACAERSATRVA